MSLIDRYLLRQFLWVWLICFSSLTGLYIVIDAIANLEEFLSIAEKSQRHFLSVMGEFYLFRGIAFFDRTSGIITLVAALFTLAGLQRFNELTALLAAGTSKWRIVQPLVIAGTVIALGAAASREWLMPEYRSKMTQTPQELNNSTAKSLNNREDAWSGVFFQGKQVVPESLTIIAPQLQMRGPLAVHGRSWQAESAVYEAATAEHQAGYRLRAVTLPKDIAAFKNLQLATGETAIHVPSESPWLAANEAFVVSEIPFDQLVDPNAWKQYASTLDLIAGLSNRALDCGNDVRVTVHARFLQPILDVSLLLLGIPLVLKGLNRNVFLAAGQGLLVIVGFLILVLTAHTLGKNYLLTPVLAAWIPVFVMLPLTAFQGEPLWE
jgi:lipopolysaccharide export system permease protein